MTWPHQVGVLPRPADSFQDRGTARQLEHAVDSGGTAVLTQVLAGLGGVGKTQLVAHHARTLWQTGQLDLLVWVTAASRDAVVTGYAQAAVEVLGADPADPELAARQFLAWLEPKPGTRRRWLVVLDDLADPADLRGLWPPASPHGRTMVTTRRRDAALTGQGRQLVPVGLFTEGEATAYLTTALAAHDRHEPADQLADLARDLGYLPLALSQAAAYLVDLGLDCATYRDRLADRALSLTDVLPDRSGLPDDQATTVAAAWSLSLERADWLPPAGLARPTLQLAAMLDPNGIPAPVLISPPVLTYLTQHRASATQGQVNTAAAMVQDVTQALRALHRLSLIDHTPSSTNDTVCVHQLVQRALRDPLPDDQYDQLVRTAADALIAAWPEIERDTALGQSLRANAEALTLHAEDALCHAAAHPVLFRIGESLDEAGQIDASLRRHQHLVTTIQRHLGPHHPHTLTARSGLAHIRGQAGDVAGAVAEFELLLTDTERVLGSGHLLTLAVRAHLAYWRGVAGDVAGAVAEFELLLGDTERVLGPDHRLTFTVRANLAYWRGEAGDAAGAVTGFELLLADTERVLGPDHPDTLSARANVAGFRERAGDAAGAVAEFEQLLTDRRRVLGPDDPDTLATRGNLAHMRGEAGDAAGAVTELQQLLPDLQRVLGLDHPDTLLARGNLAYWHGAAESAAGYSRPL